MGTAMAVTIRDIAKHINVSHSTVSRVLNDKEGVTITPETRARVLAAAEKLGYRRNYHARALQTGLTNALGVSAHGSIIEPDWQDFWGRLVTGIVHGARQSQYDLVLVGSDPGEDQFARLLRYLHERRIDALVIPGFIENADEQSVASLRHGNYPVVWAQPVRETYGLPQVVLDPEPGIRAAVEHLIGLGHRRMTWLGPGGTHSEGRVRRTAYEKAMRANDLKPDVWPIRLPLSAGFSATIRLAQEEALRLLARDKSVTGIICFNEAIAEGVYAAAAERGRRIPKDLSVVGFDDIHAHFAVPPMTVASHMLPAIGRRAAELAVSLAKRKARMQTFLGHRETIPAQLIVRESTGLARARRSE
jgi:LacI family transcriptional regulator